MDTAACTKDRRMTPEVINHYEKLLKENVDNQNTLRGYEVNLRTFIGYAGEQPITQKVIDSYKTWLLEEQNKTVFSANTMLSGVMKLIHLMGWEDLELHVYPVADQVPKQEDTYIDLEDYKKLVRQAMKKHNYEIAMLIQIFCNMNIRYPEIGTLTVEALNEGFVEITRRKKTFLEPIPAELQDALSGFARLREIDSGILFRSRDGNVMNQKKIYRDIKALCEQAGIPEGRVKLPKLKKPPVRGYYPVYPIKDRYLDHKTTSQASLKQGHLEDGGRT